MKRVLGRALGVAVLAGLVIGAGTAGAAELCNGSGLCVEMVSSQTLYTDLTPPANNLVLNAMYMQFRIHNTTGSAILNPIAHLIIPSNTAGISPSGENTDISGNA